MQSPNSAQCMQQSRSSHMGSHSHICMFPSQASHQYVNASTSAPITILICILLCCIELNPILLLLHGWPLQLPLSHGEVFGATVHVILDITQQIMHRMGLILYSAHLTLWVCFINIHPCMQQEALTQHPELLFLTNRRSINSPIGETVWGQT